MTTKKYTVRRIESLIKAINLILWRRQARWNNCTVKVGSKEKQQTFHFRDGKELKGAEKVIQMLLLFNDYKRVLGHDEDIRKDHAEYCAKRRVGKEIVEEIKEEVEKTPMAEEVTPVEAE